MNSETDCILILAAGSSRRFGTDKQRYCIDQIPVLVMTCRAVITANRPGIVVTQNQADTQALLRDHTIAAPCIQGGATRSESAWLGLQALGAGTQYQRIWIHDGARPWVDTALMDRISSGLTPAVSGCIPVLPVTDTVKSVSDHDQVIQTVPRDNLVYVQTPQLFWADDIIRAYRNQQYSGCTDDAHVVEKAGGKIAVVPGCAINRKITYPSDVIV